MESSDIKSISVQATISAPVEKVWEYWISSEHIVNWNYASDDWHTTSAENDVCIGGKFLARMEAKDGSMGFDFEGVYTSVKPYELIEYILADHRKVRIEFTKKGNDTVIVETFDPESSHTLEQQRKGWQAILSNFKKYTENLLKINFDPIIVEEYFDVSIDKVWRAITDPGQMKQWFFPEIESFKPEAGFMTQFNVHANGNDYLHIWKVTEVISFKKIVYNWTYKDYAGDSYVTWELSTENKMTKLKLSHTGIETFPNDNPDFTRESCIGGWKYFLCERLKEFLDKA